MKKKRAPAKPKRPQGRPSKPMPESIPDTPENIMRALIAGPPKKAHEWDYLKEPQP